MRIVFNCARAKKMFFQRNPDALNDQKQDELVKDKLSKSFDNMRWCLDDLLRGRWSSQNKYNFSSRSLCLLFVLIEALAYGPC